MSVSIRQLYTIASELGMVERNNKDDPFHQLVYGITGKEHVGELTVTEKKKVLDELLKRKCASTNSKGMSEAQQKYAWRLIFRLCEVDPSNVESVDRLIGAINKVLNTSASESEPFLWVDAEGGSKLIEQLKRYIKSAEKKAAKKEADGLIHE